MVVASSVGAYSQRESLDAVDESWPTQGLRFTVLTLMALILGGMTDFAGVYIGALVIGVAEAVGTVYVAGTTGMILPYAIFILVLLLRPTWASRCASGSRRSHTWA